VKCIRDLNIRSDITEIILTPLQITVGVVLFRKIVKFIPRIIRNPHIHYMDNFFLKNRPFRAFLDQCIQFIIPTKCIILNIYEHASEVRL